MHSGMHCFRACWARTFTVWPGAARESRVRLKVWIEQLGTGEVEKFDPGILNSEDVNDSDDVRTQER